MSTRATRHNGRSGGHGAFDPKHNDRSFDVDHADHIDQDRCSQNIYWDYLQGYTGCEFSGGSSPGRSGPGGHPAAEAGQETDDAVNRQRLNFNQIEMNFYQQTFGPAILAQNERHKKSRHKERIRSVEDVLNDPKTCPEETIYQLGTKDGHEDPALFTQVATELFQEMQTRFGSNFQILDWALHMDEATPHIHERHVFYADDRYGLAFPKQEKALEALGFERPNPDKSPGKYNNCKMSFDATVRQMFIEIAEKHGMTIESVPLEGKVHKEKNDFILAKQQEEIIANQAKIDELILQYSDLDSIANKVAASAYEKACDVVASTVKNKVIEDNVSIVKEYQRTILKPEAPVSSAHKSFAKKLLDNVMTLIKREAAKLTEVVRKTLSDPVIKEKNQAEIAETAKTSIRDLLKKNKQIVDEQKKNEWHQPSRKTDRGAR